MNTKTVEAKISLSLKMEIPEDATEGHIERWLKHASWNLQLPVGKILDMDNLIVEGVDEVAPDETDIEIDEDEETEETEENKE